MSWRMNWALLLLVTGCYKAAVADELDQLLLKMDRGRLSWKELLDLSPVDMDRLSPLPPGDRMSPVLWDDDHWSLLTASIQTRNWIAASYLIGKGADVNRSTRFGYSPIWLLAAEPPTEESVAIAEMLLAKGADPNVTPSLVADLPVGETPLHLAVARQNKKLIRLLLDYGADARRQLSSGTTPKDYLDEELDIRRRRSNLVAAAKGFPFPLVNEEHASGLPDEEIMEIRKWLLDAEEMGPKSSIERRSTVTPCKRSLEKHVRTHK